MAFLIALTPSAFAHEGFSHERGQAPPALQKVWDSVFLLTALGVDGVSAGTAFLFGQQPGFLFFLTAAHVIPDTCAEQAVCKDSRLVQNAVVMRNEKGKWDVRAHTGLIFRNFQLVSRFENPDMAILAVENPENTRPLLPPLPSSCDLSPRTSLFAISYPWTLSRTARTQHPIEDAAAVVKRWSWGQFLGTSMMSDNQIVAVTNVDALVGSSGGPIFTEDGTVFSFLTSILTGDGLQYTGSDNPPRAHSFGPACNFLVDLGTTFAPIARVAPASRQRSPSSPAAPQDMPELLPIPAGRP